MLMFLEHFNMFSYIFMYKIFIKVFFSILYGYSVVGCYFVILGTSYYNPLFLEFFIFI